MKKNVFSLIIFFTFLTNGSAQVVVNSLEQVGIGITNPLYKLHVVGDTYVTGNIYLGGASSFLGTTNAKVPITFKLNGSLAGNTGNSGNTSVSFGYLALSNQTTGEKNAAVGYAALRKITTASCNTAIGYSSLCTDTTGSYNTAIGYQALYKTTSGTNTGCGCNVLFDNTSGNHNTAMGYYALRYNIEGSNNTAIGYQALYKTTSGANTGCGCNVLFDNTSGSKNTAMGFYALRYNIEGSNNTATGYYALLDNTSGNHNTANGYYSLYYNTNGSYNTAIGYRALYTNTEGKYNTAIGYNADVSANNLSNATAIGNGARATKSNQVVIGNTSVSSIGGNAAWSNFSDGRAKKNIRANVPGLAFINSLQPVTYNLDLDVMDNLLGIDNANVIEENVETVDAVDDADNEENMDMPKTAGTAARVETVTRTIVPQPLSQELREARAAKEREVQTGFVAQDVEKTAKSIGYDFNGVDVDENGVYGLRYSEFVVPLVKAVQELSAQNDLLQKQVNDLTKRIEALEKK